MTMAFFAHAVPAALTAAGEPAPPTKVSPAPIEEYRGGTEDEPQVTIIRKDEETVEEA